MALLVQRRDRGGRGVVDVSCPPFLIAAALIFPLLFLSPCTALSLESNNTSLSISLSHSPTEGYEVALAGFPLSQASCFLQSGLWTAQSQPVFNILSFSCQMFAFKDDFICALSNSSGHVNSFSRNFLNFPSPVFCTHRLLQPVGRDSYAGIDDFVSA